MGFYRIFPSADTWITDQIVDNDVNTRFTGSNHGKSPALNVFSAKSEVTTGSLERARTLIRFNLAELSGKIYTDQIIPSTSITYTLKMFDMKHKDTVPSSYDLFIYPMSRSWDEGTGIDDETFLDRGYANWLSASSTQTWTTSGSDFLTTEYGSASQHFDSGSENLEVEVTDTVISWLTGAINNYGFVVKLGTPEEENNDIDYYRKVFHGYESKYVDKIPYIEARWENVITDHRKNFAYDQHSKLYLYNLIRGELTNLTEPVVVRIQDHLIGVSASYSTSVTASRVETGIYSASFYVENTASFSGTWYDIWHSGSRAYMTGTFRPLVLTGSQVDPYEEYVVDVTNLKRVYGSEEEARIKVNVRKRDWVTHLGVVSSASLEVENDYIEKMYYRIVNDSTGEIVVPFGTGSVAYTKMSYNGDGNYFNLFMNNFLPGYLYRLEFLIDINRYDKKLVGHEDQFAFKVI